jgi:predicted transcriptional regulator
MGFGGLWLAFMGWFLLTAANASYAKTAVTKILSALSLGEVMRRDCDTVSGDMDLQAFVNRHLLNTRKRYYFVTENNRPAGMISKEQVKKIPCSEWSSKTVGQVMSTLDNFQIVPPQMAVTTAYENMISSEVEELPVASNDHLAGIITREDILKDLYTHVAVQN